MKSIQSGLRQKTICTMPLGLGVSFPGQFVQCQSATKSQRRITQTTAGHWMSFGFATPIT